MINYGRNYLLLVHEHDEKSFPNLIFSPKILHKSFPNLIFSPKILHKSASWRGSLQAQVANQHQSTELDQICVIRTCERKLHENCTKIAQKLHKYCVIWTKVAQKLRALHRTKNAPKLHEKLRARYSQAKVAGEPRRVHLL